MDRGVTPKSGRVGRGQLRPGDHIYAWRVVSIKGEKVRLFSHHGIYESEDKVIELTASITAEPCSKTAEPCPRCRRPREANKHGGGVAVRCLNCFLGGNELCLFAYGVPKWFYDDSCSLIRQLTCSMEAQDPPETTLCRANKLLLNNDPLCKYHLLHNNCFHFAFYCKTGIVYHGPVALVVEISKDIAKDIAVARTLHKLGSSSSDDDSDDGRPKAGGVVVAPPPPPRRAPEPAREELPWRRWLPEPGMGRLELRVTNLFDQPNLLDPAPPPRLFGQQTIFGSMMAGATVGALFRMAPFFI